MKKPLIYSTLAIGLALTACERTTRTTTETDTAATETTNTDPSLERTGDAIGSQLERAGDHMAAAGRDATDAMREVGRDISAKMKEWRLSASEIEDDVRAGRPIVRTRDAAGAATGNIDENTLESSVKSKLQSNSQLAGLNFDVNANDKGEVELEGEARSVDQIAQAMGAALSTDGVTKVTSKIEIDPDAGK